jgi:hypothetical protein
MQLYIPQSKLYGTADKCVYMFLYLLLLSKPLFFHPAALQSHEATVTQIGRPAQPSKYADGLENNKTVSS